MRLVAVLLTLALAACGHSGSLDYSSTVTLVPGPPGAVGKVSVIDKRDEKPTRLATVRGGFGNPIYVLDTPTPVSDQVAAVVTKALAARGMSAPGTGPYTLQFTLSKLEVNQYVASNAGIVLSMQASDRSGRVIYQDAVTDDSSGFEFFGGIFTDIDKLRVQAEKLLNRAVDRMLDNPNFRAVVAGRPLA